MKFQAVGEPVIAMLPGSFGLIAPLPGRESIRGEAVC